MVVTNTQVTHSAALLNLNAPIETELNANDSNLSLSRVSSVYSCLPVHHLLCAAAPIVSSSLH